MMRYLILTLIAVLTVGCVDKGEDPIPPVPKERTVLVYLIADNSLNQYAESNIASMMRSYDSLYGTRLLVFYNKIGGDCLLLDIEQGKKSVSELKVLKKYPAKTNPCAASTLSQVVADMRALAPAKQWYSMIMWAHGSGWLPKNMHPAKVAPRDGPQGITKMAWPDEQSVSGGDGGASYSFGDGLYSFNTTFEMNELAAALPLDMKFEYIAFDACYMASVEVAYELRNKTKYFIASAAEIFADGFPYQSSMPYMLKGDVKNIGKKFYDYYESQDGPYRSATIGVVDCSKLEKVAAEIASLTSMPVILQGRQQFGRNLGRGSNYNNLFYDLSDMVHKSWGLTPAFDKAINEAVVYQAATPMLFEDDPNGWIEVDTHCGLTAYLPRLSQPQTLAIYNNDYDWAKDSKLGELAR